MFSHPSDDLVVMIAGFLPNPDTVTRLLKPFGSRLVPIGIPLTLGRVTILGSTPKIKI